MTLTVCCSKCDWTTDIETLSSTNPRRCPRPDCDGEIMLASNGERSDDPLYGDDGEYNAALFDDLNE